MAETTRDPLSPPKPLTTREIMLLSCSAVCFAFGAATWNVQRLHRSTSLLSPLVVTEQNFFPKSTRTALAACATEHPFHHHDNKALSDAFSETTGFVLEFNDNGILDFENDDRFSCLVDYFNAVRDSDANAWVMNVVVCQSSPSLSNQQHPPISWHVDQSIDVFPNLWNYAAHSVSVWYASIPEGMKGGELDIAKFSDGWLDRYGMASLQNYLDLGRPDLSSLEEEDWPYPDPPGDNHGGGDILFSPAQEDEPQVLRLRRARIQPRENMLVTFRGDAHHRVLPFLSHDGSKKRVSIVLEQYHLPATAIWRTTRYRLR